MNDIAKIIGIATSCVNLAMLVYGYGVLNNKVDNLQLIVAKIETKQMQFDSRHNKHDINFAKLIKGH